MMLACSGWEICCHPGRAVPCRTTARILIKSQLCESDAAWKITPAGVRATPAHPGRRYHASLPHNIPLLLPTPACSANDNMGRFARRQFGKKPPARLTRGAATRGAHYYHYYHACFRFRFRLRFRFALRVAHASSCFTFGFRFTRESTRISRITKVVRHCPNILPEAGSPSSLNITWPSDRDSTLCFATLVS